MAVEVFFKEGAIGAEHRHVHEQVMYCAFRANLNSPWKEKIAIHPGDSIFFPSNSLHGALCLKAGTKFDIFTPQREDF